ncbi:MAG TPA: PAS domain S-box protein, partial [Anaerolineales bacterium]|nr:PAS domain S-box protein [Anaerolineales bacterium]
LWESPATVRGLGYAQDEFVGRNIFDVVHPDDLQWTSELYARLLQEPGRRQDGVFRLRHKDGSWRWNEATVTNMLNEPGVNAIVVNYRDITERQQAEDALRQSQMKYKNLVETTHDLIWSVDADGRYLFVNHAAKEIYGYEPEEMIGRSFFEVMDPPLSDGDLDRFKEAIAHVDEIRGVENYVRHRDGRQFILSANSIVIRDEHGNLIGVTGSSHDITARKQAEEMLKEERNLLRTLIDHLPDRIFAMDMQGRKTLSNIADWKASGGETMEDVLGKTDFDTYPPELAQGFWALDKVVLDTGEPIINFEEPGLDTEGKPVWVLSTKVPLRDHEGRVAGLVGIGRDITERKQAEIERQALLEIMQGLASTDDLHEFLNLIHRSIAKVIYAENFFVVLYNRDTGLFEETYSVDQYDPPSPPSALEKSITSYVFRSGEPLLLTQSRFDELAGQGEVELVGTDSASWMGAPLKTSNGTIGVIVVQDYDNPNRYTEHDRDFLALIGSQVALAVERKQADEALRKSAAILSQAGNIAHFGAWEIEVSNPEDLNSNPLHWSDETYRIFGYEPREVPSSNALFFERVHPEDRQKIVDAVSHALAEKKNYQVEHRIIRPDGVERTVFEHAEITFNPHGQPTYILGAIYDITERKQGEDRLHLSDQILQRVNAVVLVADSQGSIVYVSPSARAILGYEPDELLGDNWWKVSRLDPAAAKREKEAMGMIARGEVPNSTEAYERAIQDRSGNTRWISWVDAIGFGNTLIGVGHDITERREAEEALRQSENRYSLASKATNDVIWEWDQITNQLFWNENALAVFGYPAEEIGMYETWWEDHIHPDDRERVLSKLNAFTAGDQSIWTDEYRFLRRDGSYAFIMDRAYVDRDASGRALRVIGAMSDITKRRQADDRLNYHARLLRHINDAVIATDEQFRITAWNRAAEKLYGWRSSEVMGRTLSEIMSFELTAEQRAEASELMKKSMASRSEMIHQRRDGQTIYVESNTIALLNEHGIMTGYVSVNRDITQRKRAEKALHQREEQYRSLFEDSPISLWVEDFSAAKQRLDELKAEGILDVPAYCREHPHFVTELARHVRIIDVNNAAMKLYHARQKSELLGSLADVFHIVLPEQFEAELIQITSGRLNFEREQVDQTLTGEKIHVNMRWSVAPGYEESLAQVIVSTVDVTERKRAEEQIQLQLQRVRALRAIDIAISSSFDLQLTLTLLLNQAIAQLKTDAAAILLFHPSTRTLEHSASRGFRSTAIREARLRLGEGYAGKAALERRMLHISNLIETDLKFASFLSLKAENFVEYYCVPLIVKGDVKGVLEIFHRSALNIDPEWLDYLETLAGQAAIAIENANLFEDLQHSNSELFQAYDATIEGWSHALDLRDKETEGHTLRVTEMTLELARRFAFTDEQLRYVRWGALLHDIGKMGVPDHILLKPDKLTDEEWERMKQHPVFALEMLSPISYLKSALDIPYCHHEKWDGTGYPRGLKGDVIPLAARLFAIVDVWDALRSDRPYRHGWSVEETLEHIKSLSGTHFDPKVVEHFLEMIERPGG